MENDGSDLLTGGGRAWRARGVLVACAALVAGVALAACDAGDAHEPPPTVAQLRARVAADSLAGDSAALAALPAALQPVLRLERYLTDRWIAGTPDAECLVLGDSLPDVLVAERRRVRLRLPDSSAVVVFARADREGATLRRVEVVRRPTSDEQLGFVWDAAGDETTEVRWPAGPRGRMETARQPRGGPVPRALRALGRRVLALSCDDGDDDDAADPAAPGLPDDSTLTALPPPSATS